MRVWLIVWKLLRLSLLTGVIFCVPFTGNLMIYVGLDWIEDIKGMSRSLG